MDKAVCKVCSEEFASDASLHKHLKVHEMRVVQYYQTHYPRYDIYNKEIIKFKNKEQYFSSEFNSRTNLRMWLKAQTKEAAQEYCKNILVSRKNKKKIVYAPTQVELRSIMSPPINYYNELFGDYYELCKSVGFEIKHRNLHGPIDSISAVGLGRVVYVDTREQRPLKFNLPIEIKTLKFGDYSFSDRDATCNCYVERKSLQDFVGTLSGGFDRFCREIERSKDSDANFIVVIESDFNDVAGFQFLREVNKKVKATPEYIMHNVRDIIQKYPHVQFLFVKGRKEAVRVIEKIFTCKCLYKEVDLQLAYDTDKL